MKRLTWIVGICLWWVFSASLSTAIAAEELRIVYNAGVAPLKFEDSAGRPQGLFPDIWRLWAERAGRRIRFIRTETLEESLDLLTTGGADLHAGLFKTEAREKFLAYSRPLLQLDYYLFTHPTVRPMATLEEASGLIVGIAKGGFTEKYVRERIPDARILVYEDFDQLFQAAQKGDVRVFVATRIGLLYWLKKNELSCLI